ncbi:hypothetical protein [Sulfitobacter brevis]|uniref:hypothetical protein n=1 Tax=Sulfitobacter brevis TaxID=74348 RepID=UPI001160B120|nr:hypothetical protein [Sulfitobacter brevis]
MHVLLLVVLSLGALSDPNASAARDTTMTQMMAGAGADACGDCLPQDAVFLAACEEGCTLPCDVNASTSGVISAVALLAFAPPFDSITPRLVSDIATTLALACEPFPPKPFA